jgi:Secretory pathway protein Sec39
VNFVSSSPGAKQERDFIEATSRLGSYKLRSRQHAGLPLLPAEIRSTPNRMDLIAALLSSQDDAYKAWESILDLALKLNAGARSVEDGEQELPPPKALTEVRALAMLCEAAIAAQDFKRAGTMGNRLVISITILRKRAAAAAANASKQDSTEEQSPHILTATEMLPEAEELGWKTCYQLAKHPGWDDYRSRLQFMGQVLALCPKERIASMTRKWNQLYEQAKEDGSAEDDLFFARKRESTKGSAGLGSLVGAYASPFASLLANAGTRTPIRPRITGIPPTPNTADSFARTPTGGAFGGRGAQLLDALGGSDHFDPAERAARAARNFFGGLTGAARHASGASQSTAGAESRNTSFGSGAFSFSKSVGWLLGDEEKR